METLKNHVEIRFTIDEAKALRTLLGNMNKIDILNYVTADKLSLLNDIYAGLSEV